MNIELKLIPIREVVTGYVDNAVIDSIRKHAVERGRQDDNRKLPNAV